MNPLTHKILADNLFAVLDADCSKEILLRKSLLWGSVRPDIFKNDIPHFKSDGEEYFFKMFEKVDKSSVVMNSKEFSCKLGQIFHYLSDFFCQAHNQKKLMGKRRSHLINEIRLQRFAQKQSGNFFDIKLSEQSSPDFEEITLIEFIEQEHARFIQDEFSFENDLSYSFCICFFVGHRLIKNKIRRSKKLRVA